MSKVWQSDIGEGKEVCREAVKHGMNAPSRSNDECRMKTECD